MNKIIISALLLTTFQSYNAAKQPTDLLTHLNQQLAANTNRIKKEIKQKRKELKQTNRNIMATTIHNDISQKMDKKHRKLSHDLQKKHAHLSTNYTSLKKDVLETLNDQNQRIVSHEDKIQKHSDMALSHSIQISELAKTLGEALEKITQVQNLTDMQQAHRQKQAADINSIKAELENEKSARQELEKRECPPCAIVTEPQPVISSIITQERIKDVKEEIKELEEEDEEDNNDDDHEEENDDEEDHDEDEDDDEEGDDDDSENEDEKDEDED